MAATRKPRARKIKFELTKSAIAGIGVVVFCLFLWMFLLGVWAGQTLLLPAYEKHERTTRGPGKKIDPSAIDADRKVVKQPE